MIQAPTAEQVREATRAVLERPEFRPDPSTEWLHKIWDWLFEQLPQWSISNPLAARLLIIALSVVLVLLLAHLGYTVAREFTSLGRPGEPQRERASSLAPLAEIRTGWKDAVRLAREALERGDLHRALWITHRILLSALDKADVLEFRKWKTNGDYVRECRDRSHAEELLVPLTTAYETVVYAHREFDRGKASVLLDRVEALAGEVGL